MGKKCRPYGYPMKYAFTGVILAGGLNTRFSGNEKAFIKIGGVSILDRVFGAFKDLFAEIILVTNDPISYLKWDALVVTDLYPVRSALTGIHAGLYFAAYPHAFFSACDTPFLKKGVIEAIIQRVEPHLDIVIPETSAGLEPLCAVYSKRRISVIEAHLARNKLKIRQIFKGARITKIQESQLRQADPELLSFFNINTPEDFAEAQTIEAEKGLTHEINAFD